MLGHRRDVFFLLCLLKNHPHVRCGMLRSAADDAALKKIPVMNQVIFTRYLIRVTRVINSYFSRFSFVAAHRFIFDSSSVKRCIICRNGFDSDYRRVGVRDKRRVRVSSGS